MKFPFRSVSFRSQLMLGALLVVTTGCLQEVDLSPVPGVRAIVADAEFTQDVDLADENGQTHPARLYFSAGAEQYVDRLVASVTILPASFEFEKSGQVVEGNDESQPNRELGSDVAKTSDELSHLPYIYIRVGTLDDEGKPLAWSAPYSAMGMTHFTDPGDIDAPVVEREGAPVHNVSGAQKLNYNWWLTAGDSGTGWTAVCSAGGASQTTYSNSYGDGRMELWHEQSGTETKVGSANYSGVNQTRALSKDWTGKYRVRNFHTGGWPVGGTGSVNCQ